MTKIQFFACVSITTVAMMIGCGSRESDSGNAGSSAQSDELDQDDGTAKGNHAVEGHAHGEGPHGGTIVDWGGGKFHVEFTVDHDKQQATAYVLGSDEKTPLPVDAKEISLAIKDPAFQVSLAASPQEGDPEGKASRFVGIHENLGTVQEFEGSMSGVVGGTPYSGNFKEENHDH